MRNAHQERFFDSQSIFYDAKIQIGNCNLREI